MRNLSNPINHGIETKQIKLQVAYKGVVLIALRILLVLPAKMTIKNNEIIIGYSNSESKAIGDIKLTNAPPSQPPREIVK